MLSLINITAVNLVKLRAWDYSVYSYSGIDGTVHVFFWELVLFWNERNPSLDSTISLSQAHVMLSLINITAVNLVKLRAWDYSVYSYSGIDGTVHVFFWELVLFWNERNPSLDSTISLSQAHVMLSLINITAVNLVKLRAWDYSVYSYSGIDGTVHVFFWELVLFWNERNPSLDSTISLSQAHVMLSLINITAVNLVKLRAWDYSVYSYSGIDGTVHVFFWELVLFWNERNPSLDSTISLSQAHVMLSLINITAVNLVKLRAWDYSVYSYSGIDGTVHVFFWELVLFWNERNPSLDSTISLSQAHVMLSLINITAVNLVKLRAWDYSVYSYSGIDGTVHVFFWELVLFWNERNPSLDSTISLSQAHVMLSLINITAVNLVKLRAWDYSVYSYSGIDGTVHVFFWELVLFWNERNPSLDSTISLSQAHVMLSLINITAVNLVKLRAWDYSVYSYSGIDGTVHVFFWELVLFWNERNPSLDSTISLSQAHVMLSLINITAVNLVKLRAWDYSVYSYSGIDGTVHVFFWELVLFWNERNPSLDSTISLSQAHVMLSLINITAVNLVKLRAWDYSVYSYSGIDGTVHVFFWELVLFWNERNPSLDSTISLSQAHVMLSLINITAVNLVKLRAWDYSVYSYSGIDGTVHVFFWELVLFWNERNPSLDSTISLSQAHVMLSLINITAVNLVKLRAWDYSVYSYSGIDGTVHVFFWELVLFWNERNPSLDSTISLSQAHVMLSLINITAVNLVKLRAWDYSVYSYSGIDGTVHVFFWELVLFWNERNPSLDSTISLSQAHVMLSLINITAVNLVKLRAWDYSVYSYSGIDGTVHVFFWELVLFWNERNPSLDSTISLSQAHVMLSLINITAVNLVKLRAWDYSVYSYSGIDGTVHVFFWELVLFWNERNPSLDSTISLSQAHVMLSLINITAVNLVKLRAWDYSVYSYSGIDGTVLVFFWELVLFWNERNPSLDSTISLSQVHVMLSLINITAVNLVKLRAWDYSVYSYSGIDGTVLVFFWELVLFWNERNPSLDSTISLSQVHVMLSLINITAVNLVKLRAWDYSVYSYSGIDGTVLVFFWELVLFWNERNPSLDSTISLSQAHVMLSLINITAVNLVKLRAWDYSVYSYSGIDGTVLVFFWELVLFWNERNPSLDSTISLSQVHVMLSLINITAVNLVKLRAWDYSVYSYSGIDGTVLVFFWELVLFWNERNPSLGSTISLSQVHVMLSLINITAVNLVKLRAWDYSVYSYSGIDGTVHVFFWELVLFWNERNPSLDSTISLSQVHVMLSLINITAVNLVKLRAWDYSVYSYSGIDGTVLVFFWELVLFWNERNPSLGSTISLSQVHVMLSLINITAVNLVKLRAWDYSVYSYSGIDGTVLVFFWELVLFWNERNPSLGSTISLSQVHVMLSLINITAVNLVKLRAWDYSVYSYSGIDGTVLVFFWELVLFWNERNPSLGSTISLSQVHVMLSLINITAVNLVKLRAWDYSVYSYSGIDGTVLVFFWELVLFWNERNPSLDSTISLSQAHVMLSLINITAVNLVKLRAWDYSVYSYSGIDGTVLVFFWELVLFWNERNPSLDSTISLSQAHVMLSLINITAVNLVKLRAWDYSVYSYSGIDGTVLVFFWELVLFWNERNPSLDSTISLSQVHVMLSLINITAVNLVKLRAWDYSVYSYSGIDGTVLVFFWELVLFWNERNPSLDSTISLSQVHVMLSLINITAVNLVKLRAWDYSVYSYSGIDGTVLVFFWELVLFWNERNPSLDSTISLSQAHVMLSLINITAVLTD